MPDADDEVDQSIAQAHSHVTKALEDEQAKENPNAEVVKRAKQAADILQEALGARRN